MKLTIEQAKAKAKKALKDYKGKGIAVIDRRDGNICFGLFYPKDMTNFEKI